MSYVANSNLGCRTVFDDLMDNAVSPGAGDYEVQAAMKYTQRYSPSLTIQNRYKPSAPGIDIGPGEYDTDPIKSQKGHSLKQSDRFVEKPVYSPGPGDYESSASFLRSSQGTFSRSGLRTRRGQKSDEPDMGCYDVYSSFKKSSRCSQQGGFTFGGRHKGHTY